MNNAKRMKLDPDKNEILYPVLSEELIQETPLTEVFVDTIKDVRNISKIVVEINSVLPIPELTHLKRIKSKDVLLFPVQNYEIGDVHKILKTKNFDTSLLAGNVRTIKVAKIAPKVRKQFEKVNKLWPCNFHSDKYLEKLSTNCLFTQEELNNHQEFMQVAIKVAKYSVDKLHSKNCVGTVVVDPKINSVVAVGFDKSNSGPCRHSVMVAIDNVSKTQNGGTWDKQETLPSGEKDGLNLNGIPKEIHDFLKEDIKTVSFGASWFKGKDELVEPSDGPYLCTGYYVYTTHEPCIMCSMGLIHSRVKRVFYGAKTVKGGLGTVCKIHTVKDLNHHYEVFSGLCESECARL